VPLICAPLVDKDSMKRERVLLKTLINLTYFFLDLLKLLLKVLNFKSYRFLVTS